MLIPEGVLFEVEFVLDEPGHLQPWFAELTVALGTRAMVRAFQSYHASVQDDHRYKLVFAFSDRSDWGSFVDDAVVAEHIGRLGDRSSDVRTACWGASIESEAQTAGPMANDDRE